jgi:pyridoxal/pyridoxine/pyridoxamine kinase
MSNTVNLSAQTRSGTWVEIMNCQNSPNVISQMLDKILENDNYKKTKAVDPATGELVDLMIG